MLLLAVLGRRRVLGEVPDRLAARPLPPRVVHRVHQLAHEAARHVDARDDRPRYVALLDLVLDAREGQRELVVRVADVRKVGVDAGEVLGVEVDVELALLVLGHATLRYSRWSTPSAPARSSACARGFRRTYPAQMAKARAIEQLEAAVSEAMGDTVELERPNDPEHGDFATNAALRLASVRRRPPRELAEELASAA